jgi:putative SOS response-associated peptidase YedK
VCYHNSISKNGDALKTRYKAGFPDEAFFQPVHHASGFELGIWPIVFGSSPGEILLLNWGLIPGWAKDLVQALEIRTKTLNARAETVFEKPAFSSPITNKRCLVPSTGFFEWLSAGKKKYPHFVFLPSNEIFSMGGIWEEWVDKSTGEVMKTFSILTTEANPLMQRIHNVKKRMPLILGKDAEREWLREDLSNKEILDLCVPYPQEEMEAYPVSRLLSARDRNTNVPEVKEKAEYPELALLF